MGKAPFAVAAGFVAMGSMLFSGMSSARAEDVPATLRNKTVDVSWTVTNTFRRPDGATMTRSVNVHRLIYISSAGRAFVKHTFSGGRKAKTAEISPEDAVNPAGEARAMTFQGGKLVGTRAQGSGAYQSIVSFDAGYTSCSVDNVLGRAGGGPVTRRLKNGAVIEIIRSEFSGKSCAIRDGNAIAN